jgi:hypothetical protein
MDSQKTQPTVHRSGFGVPASPFNGVKLELGVALVLGAVLWLAADSITANLGGQLLLLTGYGLVSMLWLVMHTRRVLSRIERGASVDPTIDET